MEPKFDRSNETDFVECPGGFRLIDNRSYPPVSFSVDTLNFNLNGPIRGEHEKFIPFINNDEIKYYNYEISDWIEALSDDATKFSIGQKETGAFALQVNGIKIPVFVYENEVGNLMHLIPQMAQRSCVWTCLSMQILDYCAKQNITDINADNVFTNIIEGGLYNLEKAIPVLNKIFGDRAEIYYADQVSYATIERKLKKGSLILSVSDHAVGGHVLCAHSYNQNDGTVRVKEPRHGWDISIKISSLYKRRKLQHSPVLQINKPTQKF